MIALNILSDAFFAAIAAMGFGAISDPSMRSFKFIAILAALGHACRYSLMTFAGFDIATGSLCGALLIGFGSIWLGKKVYSPMTVLYIPALLPMIPGRFAYNMVFSQIMFLQSMDNVAERTKYMDMFFSNTMVTCTVVFLLAVGATVPMFLFPKRAYSLTRHNR
ncbi:MAG: threonine/serine exporter family protein [Muribaculaceae bacterium]|nr:threonine/serine exporter family protein [Muribaculaceae bacterium]